MGNLIDTVDRRGTQDPDPFTKAVEPVLLDDQPASPEFPTPGNNAPKTGRADNRRPFLFYTSRLRTFVLRRASTPQ